MRPRPPILSGPALIDQPTSRSQAHPAHIVDILDTQFLRDALEYAQRPGRLLQLVINTGTTIVTFLMVFLIQNSQNRDSAAIQVKLDELIRVGAARNSLVGIEHLTDDELEDLRGKCEERARAEKAADKTVEKTKKLARRAADKVAN